MSTVAFDVAAVGADVLICSPYKFYGPHLGLGYARSELLERWRPYKVRPASDKPLGHRFETGTLPHELLAGFVAAVGYVDSIGWDAIQAHERELGRRFLDGLPDTCTLYGLNTSGQQVWSTQVGAPIPFPDEGSAIATTGLGSGDGLLVVPTDSILFAYGSCNGRCAPAPRPRPTPAPRP